MEADGWLEHKTHDPVELSGKTLVSSPFGKNPSLLLLQFDNQRLYYFNPGGIPGRVTSLREPSTLS